MQNNIETKLINQTSEFLSHQPEGRLSFHSQRLNTKSHREKYANVHLLRCLHFTCGCGCKGNLSCDCIMIQSHWTFQQWNPQLQTNKLNEMLHISVRSRQIFTKHSACMPNYSWTSCHFEPYGSRTGEQDNRVNETEPISLVTDIEFVLKSQMGKLSGKTNKLAICKWWIWRMLRSWWISSSAICALEIWAE